MTTRILLAIAILSSVAACKIGGSETTTGADAACVPAGTACAADSDCCSYGCLSGICVANPVEGGACRDTNDCAGGRLCKSGACTTPTVGMCRDTADVCGLWSQCCSGNCEGGDCTVNRPPVVNAGADVPDAPYTKVFTLANASSDPDGDPLTYGWTFLAVPAGSTAVLSSPTAAAPTFTPDKIGTYVVRLVVTEGPIGAPDRYTLEDQVTIVAVNRAPVATATAPAAQWSRNVALTISGAASDPDGDSLECSWRVTAPGETTPTEVAPFAACANPSSPSFTYTATGEGTYAVDLVVRDHDRTTGSVVNTTVATASFTSRNDPPVPATTRAPYYANMGPPSGTTPAVTLDASSSTDPNGDHLGSPGLAFFWEMVSASDGGALLPLTGAATAFPSFTPDRAATYVLQVTVSDPAQFGRPSASAPLQVSVEVGRYVQPLGHTVADSARATGTDVNRIVLAGKDPADPTKGMVWVYDTATGTEGTGIRLVDPGDGVSSGLPRLVEVTPDGTRAVVVDEGVSIWIVNLGTRTMSKIVRPFAVGDLVVANDRHAYLFKSGGDDYLLQLDLTTNAITQPAGAGYAAHGAAFRSGTTNGFYRVDTYWNDFYRYVLNNSGIQSSTSLWSGAPQCGGLDATAIWGTLTGSYVVSSCGRVYNGTTMEDLNAPLGVYPSHVDSTAVGALLVSEGTRLSRFGSTLSLTGTDVLPKWAEDGYGRTASASKAFFDSAGGKRFAIVHDTAAPVRYGVVTFP